MLHPRAPLLVLPSRGPLIYYLVMPNDDFMHMVGLKFEGLNIILRLVLPSGACRCNLDRNSRLRQEKPIRQDEGAWYYIYGCNKFHPNIHRRSCSVTVPFLLKQVFWAYPGHSTTLHCHSKPGGHHP